MQSLIGHALDFVKAYLIVAGVSAVALGVTGLASLVITDSSLLPLIESRPLEQEIDVFTVISILQGIGFTILVFGVVVSLLFLPVAMPIAYLLALAVRSKVHDRRLLSLIGGLAGTAIGPGLLVLWIRATSYVEPSRELRVDYVEALGTYGFTSFAAGAALGWFMSNGTPSDIAPPVSRQSDS